MFGQRIQPKRWHPVTEMISEPELKQLLGGMKASISKSVAAMPSHQQFIQQWCEAGGI